MFQTTRWSSGHGLAMDAPCSNSNPKTCPENLGREIAMDFSRFSLVSADLLGKLRISYMFLSKLPKSYAIFMQRDVLFQGNEGNRDNGCDVSYTKACCSIGLPLSQIWYHGPGRSIPGTTKSFKHSWMLIPPFNLLKIKQPTRKKNTPTCNPGKIWAMPKLETWNWLISGSGFPYAKHHLSLQVAQLRNVVHTSDVCWFIAL